MFRSLGAQSSVLRGVVVIGDGSRSLGALVSVLRGRVGHSGFGVYVLAQREEEVLLLLSPLGTVVPRHSIHLLSS